MKNLVVLCLCLFTSVLHANDESQLIDEFTISSSSLGEDLVVRVVVPSHTSAEQPLPVIYAMLGQVFLNERAGFRSYLASAGNPAIVVAVPMPDTSTPEGFSVFHVEGERWNAYARFVASELPAAISDRYRVSLQKHLLGFSVGSVMSLDIAMNHPHGFDRVALISPGWMNWNHEAGQISENYTDRAISRLKAGCMNTTAAIWMNWGESDADEWERLSRDNGQRVIQALRDCGVAVETGPIVPGGHGLPLIPPSLDSAMQFLLSADDERGLIQAPDGRK